MSEPLDPYWVLKVSPDSAQDEIDNQYHRLARVHDPARNPGDEEACAAWLKQIGEAYAILGDPATRKAHDERLAALQHPATPSIPDDVAEEQVVEHPESVTPVPLDPMPPKLQPLPQPYAPVYLADQPAPSTPRRRPIAWAAVALAGFLGAVVAVAALRHTPAPAQTARVVTTHHSPVARTTARRPSTTAHVHSHKVPLKPHPS